MRLIKKHLPACSSILLVVIANMLYALTVKLFVLPSGMMSSGTTGIALVVSHLTGLSVSTFVLLFNIAMLLVGLAFLGRKFAMTTVLSSLLYPLFLKLWDALIGSPLLTQNMLLNVIFAGTLLAVSLGTVMRCGASTGGMDIPPLILNRYFRIPVSVSLYVFDFIIILSQAFYHTPEDVLYGILLLIITSLVLDKMMLVGTTKTEVKIVSEKSAEITREILHSVDRGVTLLDGEGGYAHGRTQVILSIVSNRELPQVLAAARRIDPESFVIVSRVSEVWGRGFSLSKAHH